MAVKDQAIAPWGPASDPYPADPELYVASLKASFAVLNITAYQEIFVPRIVHLLEDAFRAGMQAVGRDG